MERQSSSKKNYNIDSTPKRPGSMIQHKLESIRKQIERQYHKNKDSLTSREKQNPKKSVLETKKLKKAIQESQEERFKQKYSRLQEEYLQEKKEFLITIERFNTLKAAVQTYFKSPLNEAHIKRFREFYLDQAVEIHIQKILNLGKENESLKNHVEKMLEIFEMNDFEDMIKELSEVHSSKNKKIKQSVEVENLRKDLAQRGKQIQSILDKLNKYQREIDGMREQSEKASETIQQLEKLNEKLQQARELVEEQLQEVAKQNEGLVRQNKRLRVQIQNLKSIADRLGEEVADLEEQRELLKTHIDEKIEDNSRIQSLINQNNSLMSELNDLKRQFNAIKQDAQKQTANKNIELNKYLGVIKDISQRLDCDEGQLNGRIKLLLSCEEQSKISNGLVEQFSKNIDSLMEEIKQYKNKLQHMTLEKDEYKFLLSNLNKEIENIRKEQREKTADSIQKGESLFKKSSKQMASRQQTLLREVETYKHQIQFYKKQSEALLNRNQKLSHDIQQFQGEVRQLRVQSSELKLQISSMSNELKQSQEEANRISYDLKQTTRYCNKEIQTLKRLLEQSNSQRNQFRLDNDNTRRDYERKIQILEQQLKVSESNVELRDEELLFKRRQYEIESDLDKKKIQELQNVNKESSTLLLKLNGQIEQYKMQKLRFEQEKNKLKLEGQRDKRELEQQMETITKKLDELVEEDDMKQKTIDQMSEELKRTEIEKEQLSRKYQEKIKQLQRRVLDDNGQLRDVKSTKDKLKSDFQKILKDYQLYKIELEKINQQKLQSDKMNKQLSKEIQLLKSNLNLHQTNNLQIEHLTEQYASLKHDNIEKDNLLSELEDVNGNLNIRVKELEYFLSEKSDHIKDMNLQLTSFKDSMETLLEENKFHKKQMNKLLDQLSEAKKYIDGESQRMKELIRMLGEDQECSEISRYDEIKDVYRNVTAAKDSNLVRFKKNLLELSMVEGPKLRYPDTLSPCSSISKDFNFKHQNSEDDFEVQKIRTENQTLKAQIRSLQKKITKLQNDQNMATLKAMVTKFFDAILTEDTKKEAQLLEATRIILRVLDFTNNSREDILTKLSTLRKKKSGFFAFLK